MPKYYTRTKNGFAIQKTIDGKKRHFCVCEDEKTAQLLVKELEKVGWNSDLIDYSVYNISKKRQGPKYYTQDSKGNFEIRKIIDGKQTNYGVYKDEEMTQMIVEKLKEVNWDKKHLDRIREEVGWVNPNKNYYYHKKMDMYGVKHVENGVEFNFGWYFSKEDAACMVSELRKLDWKVDDLKKLADEIGVQVHVPIVYNYYYNNEKKKYQVNYMEDNEYHFVGLFDTREEAAEAVKNLQRKR